MKKRILAVLLSFFVTGSSMLCPAAAQAEEMDTDVSARADAEAADQGFIGLDAEYHTQEQIREYYQSHPVKGMEAKYITEPSVTAPYAAGELTEETRQDALNALNLYRYIAGVPAVAISDRAQKYAQSAAMLMAVHKQLNHYPSCPEGMDSDLYDLAAFGAGNSNLAAVGNKLSDTILGYMLESNGDYSFRHRRQLLKYDYPEVGFGLAKSVSGGYYSATYVDANMKEDKIISYPGQNQPLEYFGPAYAWTVVIPEKVEKSKINVKLTDTKTGEVWNFNQDSKDFLLSDMGKSACAIFAPSPINYRDGDKYRVEITGIANPISYEVNMFCLKDHVPLASMNFQWLECFPFEGETYTCKLNFTPSNATNKIVEWSSADPDIAVAEWGGIGVCKVIAKKPGTTVVTAVSEDGGYRASMKVTVKAKADSVSVDKTDVTIGVGQSFELKGAPALDVEFKTDYDTNIVKMERTSHGHIVKVTGRAAGQTEIHAYPYSNPDIQAVCKVTVVEPVFATELRLNTTEAELEKDGSVQLDVEFIPSNVTCKEMEWKTSNINIARVKDGKVEATGNSYGQAVITAKALDGSGQTASCTVTVYGRYGKMEKPVVRSYTSEKVILKSVSGCEYSMDKQNWQDSNEFTNLQPDHAYTFYIRKKAGQYIRTGEASEGTTVKTKAAACSHKNTSVKNIVQATCTEKGYTGDTYCTDCQKIINTGTTISALGHNYASKSESGKTTYTCNRCGSTYTETNHAENDSGNTPGSSGAGQADGSSDKTPVSSNTDNLNDTDGKADNTVKKGDVFTAGSYKYKVTGRLELAFAGFASKKLASVKIPNTVTADGKVFKVTSVGSGAFLNTDVKNIAVGSNIKEIGTSAFRGCRKLKKVTLGSGIVKIGNHAFKNCRELKSIALPAKVVSIGSGAFSGCGKLKAVNIRTTKLKTVGRSAFKGISKSAKIKVPSKKLSAYKKLLKNKGQDKKVKILK